MKAEASGNRIYMIGPSFRTQGGISSVLSIYRKSFSDRFKLVFIPSYSGKGRLFDIVLFALALVRVLFASMFVKNSIFHIHTSSKGSFFRKSMIAYFPEAFGRKFIYHIHGAMFDKFMENSGTDKMNRIIELSRRIRLLPCLKAGLSISAGFY